jgi:ribosomal protein L11 methyltransferase
LGHKRERMSQAFLQQARFTLICPPRDLEAAQALADLIDEHIAIDAMAVTVNETDEALALWNTVAYFEDEAAAHHAIRTLNIENARIEAVPDEDWVRRSLEGLAPVVAGRFYLHGSHDRDKRRSGGHSFEIDAGTAFGTGHHGTTAGCMMILDALLKHQKPKRIFDLGCGTGVLAIAAAKASSVNVLATDIDPEAVRVTKLNAALNNLGPQINALTAAGLHHHAIRTAGPFDLIFANILARPLVSLAHGLCNLLKPGGTIILSGLTRDQLRWVSAAYKARGLVPTHTVKIENWVALAMKRAAPNAKRLKQDFRRSHNYTKAP